VYGVVQDSTGQPIRYATVYLLGRSDSARVDSTGRYEFPRVPAGTVTVRATFIGYRAQQQEVTLKPGESKRLDLCLPVVLLDYGPSSSPHCSGWPSRP
jgi:hypothetical protein